MRFRTKIDWWVYLILAILLWQTVHISYLTITQPELLTLFFSMVFLVFIGLIALPILFGTYYQLCEDYLLIRCGLFIRLTIPYHAVKRLCPMRGFLPCCGLSTKRLGLFYWGAAGKCQCTLAISPRDREVFIKEMQKKNPDIDTNTGKSDQTLESRMVSE